MIKEVFFYFLRLGIVGFGGPMALVSNMQNDLIEKRKWMATKDFNASFSLIKAMPGPVAFMTAVFLGRHRAGFLGGLVAGVTLVLPAFVLMILFSLFFKSVSSYSSTKILLSGMQMAALGVILASLKTLAKNYLKQWFFWVLVIVSGYINFFSPGLEPVVIISFGAMMVVFFHYRNRFYDLASLFWVCFKAGAFVFGTGLAVVPMLKNDVVLNHHWLTQSEFLDALAFGQMTPGPVVITATYIGHRVDGFLGAVVSTVAIFSAAFFHMNTWFPKVVSKLGEKVWINHFIYGAIAAVVGPIIVTVFKLASSMNPSILDLSMAMIVFLVTLLDLIPVWILIPLAGVAKLLLFLVRV